MQTFLDKNKQVAVPELQKYPYLHQTVGQRFLDKNKQVGTYLDYGSICIAQLYPSFNLGLVVSLQTDLSEKTLSEFSFVVLQS